jgi:hypothetical protein
MQSSQQASCQLASLSENKLKKIYCIPDLSCYHAVMINSDQAMLAAVKAALNGARKYGTAQHKIAIKNLAMKITAAPEEEIDVYVDAIVKISNISALQQKLAKAGVIDRESREQVKANLFDALKA